MYYHGARYYIPWLARWTAVDPKETKYTPLNPYNYCFNNPIVFSDPNGEDGRISSSVDKKGRTTLTISAVYYYNKNDFDSQTLKAVRKEYGDVYKDIKYKGGSVDVKFDIQFKTVSEGIDVANLRPDSKGYGDVFNVLISEKYEERYNYENSNYFQVGVDLKNVFNNEYTYEDKAKGEQIPYTITNNDMKNLLTSVISHGIGHNIGLEHSDKGIMKHQGNTVTLVPDMTNPSTIYYQGKYEQNHITRDNVQSLIDKIDGMQEHGRGYWFGQLEIDEKGKRFDISDTGIILWNTNNDSPTNDSSINDKDTNQGEKDYKPTFIDLNIKK